MQKFRISKMQGYKLYLLRYRNRKNKIFKIQCLKRHLITKYVCKQMILFLLIFSIEKIKSKWYLNKVLIVCEFRIMTICFWFLKCRAFPFFYFSTNVFSIFAFLHFPFSVPFSVDKSKFQNCINQPSLKT